MVSRLEDLSRLQMAIAHANKIEFKQKILGWGVPDLYEDWWYDEGNKWFKAMKKKVPDTFEEYAVRLRDKIPINVVIFCVSQSLKWAKLHQAEFGLSLNYYYYFLRSSFFTSKGLINKEMAARELVKDTKISSSKRFCIACYYCFSDVIHDMWLELPSPIKDRIRSRSVEPSGNHKIVDLWLCILSGEKKSFSLAKFKESLEMGNDVSFKANFKELNMLEKKEALIFSRKTLKKILNSETRDFFSLQPYLPFQPYIEMALFLIHNLDEEQLNIFFSKPKMLYLVLYHLLSWQYQHFFMDTVNRFWEVLSKCEFYLLLHRILSLRKSRFSCELCDYCYILRDFWRQSPLSLKRFFFLLEGTDISDRVPVLTDEENKDVNMYEDELYDLESFVYNYFLCSLNIEDKEIIKLIFDKATLEEKSNIEEHQGIMIGESSLSICDLTLIDLFIKYCIPEERVESFKRDIVNSGVVMRALWNLILRNKFDELHKILSWALTDEGMKAYMLNLCLDLTPEQILSYNSKQLKCIDKSWEYLSPDEIKNIKKRLLPNDEDIFDHYKSSLLNGRFKTLDFYLNWIFSSESDVIMCKRELAFKTMNFINCSYISKGLNHLKKFVEWSSLSPEECRDFKRGLAFSKSGIEFYGNCVAPEKLCKTNSFIQWTGLRESEIKDFKKKLAFSDPGMKFYSKCVSLLQLCETDAFVQWAELTESEENKFKKQLVFDKHRIIFSTCVDCMLNGKENFIKKLFSWTKFSEEETREFYSILLEKLDVCFNISEKEDANFANIRNVFNGFPLTEEKKTMYMKNLVLKSGNVIVFLVKKNKLDELEELLSLCISSKKEISEFMEKNSSKIHYLCLNLISDNRLDDIDRLFILTGIHDSLKNKLFETIISHRYFYEWVVTLFMEKKNEIERSLNWLSENDLLSGEWKESFLKWCYEREGRSSCFYTKCSKYGFLYDKPFCYYCDRISPKSKNILKFGQMIDKHINGLKKIRKRKLESNTSANKKSRLG